MHNSDDRNERARRLLAYVSSHPDGVTTEQVRRHLRCFSEEARRWLRYRQRRGQIAKRRSHVLRVVHGQQIRQVVNIWYPPAKQDQAPANEAS